MGRLISAPISAKLSHLSAHVANRLFRENLKSIPNILNGKNFKKCNSPDFKFYLGKLNNKIFPIWCNVNFVSVFTALNNTKKQRKFNITPYGEKFIS